MAHSRSILKHSGRYLILLGLLCTFLPQFTAADNDTSTEKKKFDRCDPLSNPDLGKARVCQKGIVIPVWQPANTADLTGFEIAGRAIVYLIALIYLFLGVSIIADRFMAAIEVITSKEKTVVYTRSDGERVETTVRIWNETISNLTLMALGSSAPEIMLSVIEVIGKGFEAGDLGPSTIVGSASFNLFIIIAICMYVIPDDEVRKIKHLRVFFMTASWSILAYIWLYVILAVTSPGVVEIWEGVLTFVFFPILVALAYIADQRLLVYKYMYKRYRRKKGIIVETEGKNPYDEDYNMDELGDAEGAGVSGSSYFNSDDPENNRVQMVELMRDLRKKHPDADMNDLAKMATAEALNRQQKSRAFYRIHATRMMTGSGNVMKKNALGVDKPDVGASMMNLTVDDEGIAKVFFDPPEVKVMENCGNAELQIVRRGGDINSTVYVDYRTVDGTANAGSDYTAVEDTAVFKPGETLCTIQVPILDDDIFEEDEFFKVELSNVRFGGQDGTTDFSKIRLESPAVANVVILDDDHAGIFSFKESQITVAEGVGVLKVEVSRNSGARGTVAVPYKTVPGSAKGGGQDYLDSVGVLEFSDDETMKCIKVTIVDDEEYEKNKMFSLELGQPRLIGDDDSGTDVGSDSGINGQGDDEMLIKNLSEDEEEARRIAELGKPRLGETNVTEIVIEESYEFKNTVDKLIKKANLAVVVGTSSWREQFVEALQVSAGDDDDEEEDEGAEEADPTCCDYIMHFLTVFWKLIFACVPPTDIAGGWACFTVSICGIGALTAVIGDVASHFGCVVNLNDEVTAVTLVAMGTSVPDTFASKVAACGDPYADASVGNVTGSNAVNVFLGIGIAWTMAAIYHAVVGKTEKNPTGQFNVKVGNLAFSVTVFSIFAVFAITVLMLRRRASTIQAELGGPRPWKTLSAVIFVCLWVLYVLLAALDSYCLIKTF